MLQGLKTDERKFKKWIIIPFPSFYTNQSRVLARELSGKVLYRLVSNYIEELHTFFDLLEIEAYYSKKIVYVINFPIICTKQFSYYHLLSIPTIIPNFLIMNKEYSIFQ